MSIVGERSILVVIFDDRTTIGMVRLYAKETANGLTKIFAEITEKSASGRKSAVEGDFVERAQEKLDDIFQD